MRAHEALGLAAQGGGEGLKVQAMVHVAQILEAEGRLPETMSLLDEIVALARRTRHQPALMYALAYRGTILYWKREYGPAEEHFVEGADVAARLRHGFGFLVCRMFRDLCRARLGRISEALAGFAESADLPAATGTGSGSRAFSPTRDGCAARSRRSRGRPPSARKRSASLARTPRPRPRSRSPS